jgi:hypothetical protein
MNMKTLIDMKRTFLLALAGIVLAMPSMGQESPSQSIFNNGSYEQAGEVKAAPAFKDFNDLMRRLPAMPKAEQLMSAKAKYIADSTIYTPYKMAVEQYLVSLLPEQSNIVSRMDAARRKQAEKNKGAMQQYQQNVNAGLAPSQEELMALYMSGEINPNMSEEQMMDVMAGKFAAKWGISKQEYLKIIGMAQKNEKQAEAYMKQNHPDLYNRLYAANKDGKAQNDVVDPRDDKFVAIGEQIKEEQEKFVAAMQAYKNENERILRSARPIQEGEPDFNTSNVAGEKLVEVGYQLYKEWLASNEAKQIDAIEKALWERVDKWERTLDVGTYGWADVPYPDWFTDERKKENALIDQWNKRVVGRWTAVTNAYQAELKAIFDKVASLDAENEKVNKQGEPENVIYLGNRQLLLMMYGEILNILTPYEDALRFPCIEHFEETGETHLGKG